MSKASKQRACPAVARTIPVSECVAHRHQPYACPETCPHDPFAPANYTRFLELEGKLDRKCMEQLREKSANPAAVEKSFQQVSHHPNLHSMHAWYEWHLFFATGADGLSFVQRWEKAGFSELKSDQRVLLRAKMKTRVALLEIQRVVDGERVEAVDLLAPDAPLLRLQDRSLASVATRFTCALTWVYPLPHYWRLSGTAVLIPEMAQFTAREIVTEIVSHLGGPAEPEALRRWLAEHLVRFDDALQATARIRRMQLFASMDARYGKAVYELQAPFATCRDRLDKLPNVEPEDLADTERGEGFAEGRVWFTEATPSKQATPSGARPVLGRVLLGQSHWRLEAFGSERFAQLRQAFEQPLGPAMRFTGERLDDLGAKTAAEEPTVNDSLVPPRLLTDPEKIVFASSRVALPPDNRSRKEVEQDLARAADQAFLDDKIPALDNRTPREAARDPALRPRLIRLLKQRVRQHHERNLETGRTDDINWLLRELGTTEILFDPPPWRPPRPKPAGPEESPEEDLDEALGIDPNLPLAPPLPGTPLSYEEVAQRLDDAMNAFHSAADAEDALHASGFTLIEDAGELTADMLSDDEFALAVPFLLQAALALVPSGHRAPVLNFDTLAAAFQENLRELDAAMASGSMDRFMDYPKECNQPNLMLLLMNEILHAGAKAPKKLRPSPQAQGVMLALLRAVVDELHNALRRRSLHY